MIHPALAKNLRVALAEQGWTQERLARELNVANRTVAGWCLGETRPHYGNLCRAAKMLGRDPYWFFADHDKPVAA